MLVGFAHIIFFCFGGFLATSFYFDLILFANYRDEDFFNILRIPLAAGIPVGGHHPRSSCRPSMISAVSWWLHSASSCRRDNRPPSLTTQTLKICPIRAKGLRSSHPNEQNLFHFASPQSGSSLDQSRQSTSRSHGSCVQLLEHLREFFPRLETPFHRSAKDFHEKWPTVLQQLYSEFLCD